MRSKHHIKECTLFAATTQRPRVTTKTQSNKLKQLNKNKLLKKVSPCALDFEAISRYIKYLFVYLF